jgi:tRNA U34 2-thiouridine synthase MnmA/TrmU
LHEQKALIAMSGGVKSSVAAYLLKKQGFVNAHSMTVRIFALRLTAVMRCRCWRRDNSVSSDDFFRFLMGCFCFFG